MHIWCYFEDISPKKKKKIEGTIYVSTTNVQGFIYFFGIFYLKIGKFYTFFQLGKGPIMGPKISPGKSLVHLLAVIFCGTGV